MACGEYVMFRDDGKHLRRIEGAPDPEIEAKRYPGIPPITDVIHRQAKVEHSARGNWNGSPIYESISKWHFRNLLIVCFRGCFR
jgi:hypothetical protein